MRCLERNKQPFYYSLYSHKEPILDEYENETGEYKIVYSNPVQCKGNISVGKGEAQSEIFGISTEYDKVIIIDDTSCPIDEESIIFIDIIPQFNEGNYNNNYIVKRVAKSLNHTSIAISEVGSDYENQT